MTTQHKPATIPNQKTALAFSEPRYSTSLQPHLPSLAGRAYKCQCGCPVFFRNSECLACGTPLGYDAEQARLLPLMPGPDTGTWVRWQNDGHHIHNHHGHNHNGLLPPPAEAYTRCANLQTPAACNWLVPYDPAQAGPLLCRACRLNRIIPDLNDPAHPENGVLWGRIEQAKRRLVSALLALGLPVVSRVTEDTARGMMFDFLRPHNNGPHIMTGHKTGLITLNLQEADDAVREAVRAAMREPYRTLLGHFRHEVGHYYWDRLVWDTPWLDDFRQLFGDERLDYAESLRQSYQNGPPPQWWLHYVSAYASTHPWEDWAECWAHYLHMRDTVDTALSFGLATDKLQLEFTPFTIDSLHQPGHPDAQHFLDFLNDWTRLTTMLNEMSRSMGQPDFYPFVLPLEVIAKLHFIHLLVASASWLPDDADAVQAAVHEVDRQIDEGMHEHSPPVRAQKAQNPVPETLEAPVAQFRTQLQNDSNRPAQQPFQAGAALNDPQLMQTLDTGHIQSNQAQGKVPGFKRSQP